MSEQENARKRGLSFGIFGDKGTGRQSGGEAPHQKRGLRENPDSDTRRAVARKGGLARGERRRKAKQAKDSATGNESLSEIRQPS